MSKMWYDNEISMGIMTRKYLHQGEKPEDFIPRVVSIFSEELQPKAREVLEHADFLPAGRTLFGAGLKGKRKVSLSNCFVPGTLVLTTNGFKPIEHVCVGDQVVTSKGVHRVNNVMSRHYTGDLYRLVSKHFLQDIICTPNHKFLTPNGWVRADRFFPASVARTSMKIKTVEHHFQKYYPLVDLTAFYPQTNMDRIALTETGQIVHETMFQGKWRRYASSPINRCIHYSKDFRYFIGRWIGDGSITRRRGKRDHSILQIVFNATTEREAAQRCINIGTAVFGIKPSVRVTEQNVIAVRWENPIIGNFFYREFGSGCDRKYLSPMYLGDMEIALGLLDSDGMIDSHGGVSISLKNPSLISWLRITLAMNGISSTYVNEVNDGSALQLRISNVASRKYLVPYMSKTYYDGRNNYYPSTEAADWATVEGVEVIENADTMVYNLSVEDVHEYNVNGVICHNCFVMPTIADNIESIFDMAKIIARIFSYGGGCGLAIDNLRPKGASVNNSALTSSGAVSFLNVFDVTGSTIGQNGRRAALMVGLRCDHPDIEEFLRIKQNNEKLASMNISIKFTDEFMQAVLDNRNYTLWFEGPECGRIEKTINARNFFMEFCQTQMDYGEPGSIFIDRVQSYHILSQYPNYKIEISNPCLAGYTRILTDQGYFPIELLVGKEVNVWNGYRYSRVVPRVTGHNQKMVRVAFSNGAVVDCTLYHKFIMEDGTRKEAKDLLPNDSLCKWYTSQTEDNGGIETTACVVSVEPISDAETVYCLTEPFNHSFVAEGVLVGNCAEYFGIGGNSCNLGSINLYNVVKNKFTDQATVDWDKLRHVTDIGVRMMDEILDYGLDMQPLELNKQVIEDWRSIGLGIFGMADAFVAMGVKYGSPNSCKIAQDIMSCILHQAIVTSSDLAKEKGSFKQFDAEKTIASPIIQLFPDLHDKIRTNGLRNGSLLSVAPTGTISLFAGKFTGGLEPMFKIAYTRTSHSMEDSKKSFTVYARGVEDLLKYHGCENLTPMEAKKRFPFLVESHEVPYQERVRFQASLQKFVDNAISSTVNLPNSATVEDIFNIYIEAWKQGVKGITVFRDGCKRGNILGIDDKKIKIPEGAVPEFDTVDPPSRREIKIIDGTTVRESTSCVKSMYVTVNKTPEGKAFEIFTNASGGCKTNINTIARLISLSLRSGVKVDRIIEELRANQCPACQVLRRQGKQVALSCSNAIADAIESAMGKGKTKRVEKVEKEEPVINRECPECGKKTLIPEGKCVTCSNCGWSRCE